MPERFVTSSNRPIPVVLHDKIPDKSYYQNLKLRPVSTTSTVLVYDATSSKWVSSTDFWTSMPMYTSNILLKPLFSRSNFDLRFEILDTKTGKVYSTSTRSIWNDSKAKNVLSRLVLQLPAN